MTLRPEGAAYLYRLLTTKCIPFLLLSHYFHDTFQLKISASRHIYLRIFVNHKYAFSHLDKEYLHTFLRIYGLLRLAKIRVISKNTHIFLTDLYTI